MLKNIPVVLLLCFFVHVRGEENAAQRIAGGDLTVINEYPFAAALLTNRGYSTYRQACGGTILTTSAILSAASCFYDGTVINPVSWWRARVGSTYSNSGGTIYIINRITIHENFSPTTLVNDIAVLRTNLNINLQPTLVEAARIAGVAYPFANNQAVRAIGWGATSSEDSSGSEQLRVANVWLVNQQTCSNRYSATGFPVTDNMLCAGWLDVGIRGQCAGDVGSPLLDSTGAVVGVFSRTEDCADDWYPAINTRVPSYTRWIITAATS